MIRFKITKEETKELGIIVIPKAFTLVPTEGGFDVILKDADRAGCYNLDGTVNNITNILSNYAKRVSKDTIHVSGDISFDIVPSKDPFNNIWKFWIKEEESVWAQDPYQFNVCTQIFKDNQ